MRAGWLWLTSTCMWCGLRAELQIHMHHAASPQHSGDCQQRGPDLCSRRLQDCRLQARTQVSPPGYPPPFPSVGNLRLTHPGVARCGTSLRISSTLPLHISLVLQCHDFMTSCGRWAGGLDGSASFAGMGATRGTQTPFCSCLSSETACSAWALTGSCLCGGLAPTQSLR